MRKPTNAIQQCVVVEAPSSQKRVGTQTDDWHATMFQSFDAKGDSLFLFLFFSAIGATSLFCMLEPHPSNYKRRHANSVEMNYTQAEHPKCDDGPSSRYCMLRPQSVKWWTSQCTTVQHTWFVLTSATGHTWPHPTGMLGLVSGGTDLNLSTHRGQYNNFDSIQGLVWSCSLTMWEAPVQHNTVPVVNNSPTCWYIQHGNFSVKCHWFPDHADTCLGLGIKSWSL